MFVGKAVDENQIYQVYNPRISLEVSEDRKSAKMTLVNECLLRFANGEEIEDYTMPIGGFSWKQEIVFDLSGENAVITETHFGLTVTDYKSWALNDQRTAVALNDGGNKERYAEETSRCLKSISDDHAKFRQSSQKHTASFAQVFPRASRLRVGG